tara:strand:+ start:139 stop:876 length:738 start_codon:yes stop_codon:yes gene_type:complete
MGELRESINELFNLQGNKLFRTMKGLTVDPGGTIRTFASGDRKKFLHPFTYVITILGISIFLNSFIDNTPEFSKNASLKSQSTIKKLEEKEVLSEKEEKILMFEKFMTEYFQSEGSEREKTTKYSTYISFFLMSLIHLLVYKNLKFGFKKNIWFSFYIFGNASFLALLFLPFLFIFKDGIGYLIVTLLIVTLSSIYQAWSASKYYEISIWRALKKYLFSFLLLIFSSTLVYILFFICLLAYITFL